MIKGVHFKESLNTLLLFGDDPIQFEKKIISGFNDGFVFIL